jgi:hypothetical protein
MFRPYTGDAVPAGWNHVQIQVQRSPFLMRHALFARRNTSAHAIAWVLFLMLACGLSACGSTTAANSGDAPPANGTGTSAEAPSGGGDEPNVVYQASSGAFHFSHPQSWTQTTQPGETIRFTGRDEFISVTLVHTSLSPADYAAKDQAALVAASPNFQGKAPVAVHVKAGDGVMVAYAWTAGPSPVTGKTVPSAANRTYIAGPNGALAVYTYSAPMQVYDPYGAADFVNLFSWQ